MTKERRIAIELWEALRQDLPAYIAAYKKNWLRQHYPQLKDKWRANCWFCQYFAQEWEETNYIQKSHSDQCPLNICKGEGKCYGNCYWYKVFQLAPSEQAKQEAADRILYALRTGR